MGSQTEGGGVQGGAGHDGLPRVVAGVLWPSTFRMAGLETRPGG